MNNVIPKNFFTKVIGEEIKRLRKASSFSGTKMASELGISQQQYSRYERRVNTISVDALLNILCILDCDVSSFFSYLRQQIEKDNHELYDTLKPLFYNFETHTEIEKYFLKRGL
ncbi:helix-turn-helix domain-containing protein [Providencia stuartii]